jgi:ureidoglycolate amidohydrolase
MIVQQVQPLVDQERLMGQISELATFSLTAKPAITRLAYSAADLAAKQYLKSLFEQADLFVHEDGLGNLFARWEGQDPGLAAVAVGSHVDTANHAGMYKGTVGVLGALEAIRALQNIGFKPLHSIEIVVFAAREETR